MPRNKFRGETKQRRGDAIIYPTELVLCRFDTIGTIVFEKHSHWIWHGQGGHKETYEYSFQFIADSQAVFNQVVAARTADGVLSTSAFNEQV